MDELKAKARIDPRRSRRGKAEDAVQALEDEEEKRSEVVTKKPQYGVIRPFRP